MHIVYFYYFVLIQIFSLTFLVESRLYCFPRLDVFLSEWDSSPYVSVANVFRDGRTERHECRGIPSTDIVPRNILYTHRNISSLLKSTTWVAQSV